MLENTFVHLSGVGPKSEQSLWTQGCLTWSDYLADPRSFSVGSASKSLIRQELEFSQHALEEGRHQFFARRLKMKDAWRAYEAFADSCLYLDIETDGTNNANCVTTIGMYDGNTFRCLVQGVDLEVFRDAISHYSMIVTFFGTGFDLPVLQRRFRGIDFDQIHLDLCPTLRAVGYRGGLKKIEKDFGIKRSPETEGLSGLDAVRLWRQYRWGRESALDRLIAYNREDVVNLKQLAEKAMSLLRQQSGFPGDLEATAASAT
ncbi:MAG: ribonuclease H-like domain-containing protein [Fimbriimonadales bacterium]